MKIGDLNQHCGECSVIEFCGNPFGFCLCTDERFVSTIEEIYAEIGGNISTVPFEMCKECKGHECETCDYDDAARDFMCEQIADGVFAHLSANRAEEREG